MIPNQGNAQDAFFKHDITGQIQVPQTGDAELACDGFAMNAKHTMAPTQDEAESGRVPPAVDKPSWTTERQERRQEVVT